jgi:putative transposase
MEKHFGCCRWVYNWALAKKIEVWKTEARTIGRYELDAILPILKRSKDTEWLSEVNAQSLQSEIVNLEMAYGRFFKDKKGFPKFKSKKKSRQRFQCPQRVSINFEARTISFPKIDAVNCIIDRQFKGNIKTVGSGNPFTLARRVSASYKFVILCSHSAAPTRR